MAGLPPLPNNIFGANHRQAFVDGSQYLTELKDRLDVIRNRLEDLAVALGFRKDEPITFNGFDDLTGVQTLTAYKNEMAAYQQAIKRAEDLGEAIRLMWHELPFKAVDGNKAFAEAIPKDILVDILAFAFPYFQSLDSMGFLSDEDRSKIRGADVEVVESTQDLFDRLKGKATVAMIEKKIKREDSQEPDGQDDENDVLVQATQYEPALTKKVEDLLGKLDIKSTESENAEARHVAEMREKTREVSKANKRAESLETKVSSLSVELGEAREESKRLQARLEKAEGSIKNFESLVLEDNADELAQVAYRELRESYNARKEQLHRLRKERHEIRSDLERRTTELANLVQMTQGNDQKIESCNDFIADWRTNTDNDGQSRAVVSAIVSHLAGYQSGSTPSRDQSDSLNTSFTHHWDHMIGTLTRCLRNESFDVRLFDNQLTWPLFDKIFVNIAGLLSLDHYTTRFEDFLEYSEPGKTYCLLHAVAIVKKKELSPPLTNGKGCRGHMSLDSCTQVECHQDPLSNKKYFVFKGFPEITYVKKASSRNT